MSRGTDAAVTNPFRGVTPKPVTFVQIATGIAAPATLRYTDAPVSLTWNGQTWTARPLAIPEMRMESQGEAGGASLRIGDGDGVLAGYMDSGGATFEDQRVVFYLTDLTVVEASGTAAIQETFVVESYERGEGYLVLHLRHLLAVAGLVETPIRIYQRSTHPGLAPSGAA